MPVLITCKFEKDLIKPIEKRWKHGFPHYKSVGAFCCHGNQCFDPICPKTLCSLSPTLMMLHIKLDQDRSTGFRGILKFHLKSDRMTEGQGKSSLAPTFQSRGYNEQFLIATSFSMK